VLGSRLARGSRRRRPPGAENPSRGKVLAVQLLIVVVVLAAWQWLPSTGFVEDRLGATQRIFLSNPRDVATSVWHLLVGGDNRVTIWPYLKNTLLATFIAAASGTIGGAILGLLCSSSKFAAMVTEAFAVALNSVPRIALIPIIVVLVGGEITAASVNAFIVVVFIAFFNAFEGGRSVPIRVAENAYLMGASRWQAMRWVQLPYVIEWTIAAIPNAISFSLIVVVTTELLTGSPGVGALMLQAMTSLDASLEFALAVLLSVVGIAFFTGAKAVSNRLVRR
jgi:NitT/TauT family transport system permease protein